MFKEGNSASHGNISVQKVTTTIGSRNKTGIKFVELKFFFLSQLQLQFKDRFLI